MIVMQRTYSIKMTHYQNLNKGQLLIRFSANRYLNTSYRVLKLPKSLLSDQMITAKIANNGIISKSYFKDHIEPASNSTDTN